MLVVSKDSLSKKRGYDVTIVPFWIDGKKIKRACDGNEYSELIENIISMGDFLAKSEEMTLLYPSNGDSKRLILLGLGKKEGIDLETCRKSYASAVRFCRRKKWSSIKLFFPSERNFLLPSFEGMYLANYAFDALKRETTQAEPGFLIKEVCCPTLSSSSLELLKRRAKVLHAVHVARDLVNGNADDITPKYLASHAKELASKQLKVKVLHKKELEKEKMGLLLAVSRGSSKEPALIILEYIGNPKSKDYTALIGKGITYDTGGLNLKISGSMETMKCDMSGSAAVLATMQAIQDLKLKHNVIGVIAAAENAIGPDSCKPGDVYVSHFGKSIEINDTDAEGRLVLADAISYVQKYYQPSRIIDLATLTGGIVVALGEEASGLFCNDDTLALQLQNAGERTFERVWRMPLYPEYKETLKSSVADMKNSAGRKASSCKGAAFLQQFIIGKTSWAHLDIAGTAYLSETKVYHPTFATGVGVRLLIDFLENL